MMRRHSLGLALAVGLTMLSTPLTWAQEGAIKLADGIDGVRGGRGGEGINTGFVVGDRGVFVYSCDAEDYDRRL